MVTAIQQRDEEIAVAPESALATAIARAHRRYALEYHAEGQLSVLQAEVLTQLYRLGGPASMSTAARLTGASIATLGHSVAELVARQMVVRRGIRGDRRVVLISLTRAGSELAETVEAIRRRLGPEIQASLAEAIAPADREERT